MAINKRRIISDEQRRARRRVTSIMRDVESYALMHAARREDKVRGEDSAYSERDLGRARRDVLRAIEDVYGIEKKPKA